MTTPRRYSRPPITEAIIDFQVERLERVELADLERCGDAAYPVKTVWAVDAGQVTPGEAVGFQFASADTKQLFRVHFGGFSAHRLAPYPGWVPFRDEARRLWDIYRQLARPRKVNRVAVRYINRLDLPLPVKEIKDYLRTAPEVSPDLPQGVAGFYMQLNIPQPDIKSTLMLREVHLPSGTSEVASIILDLDLHRSDELPPIDAELWALIESLRARKNETFEACITDRTRGLIR